MTDAPIPILASLNRLLDDGLLPPFLYDGLYVDARESIKEAVAAERARIAAAWDEGAKAASQFGGAYLRSLYAQNPYRNADDHAARIARNPQE